MMDPDEIQDSNAGTVVTTTAKKQKSRDSLAEMREAAEANLAALRAKSKSKAKAKQSGGARGGNGRQMSE